MRHSVPSTSIYTWTVSIILIFTMSKWWAVVCQYRLMNRCIVSAMNLLARYKHCISMRANCGRIILGSALSQGQPSIIHNEYQYVQNIMKTIIDGTRCWMNNPINQSKRSVNNFWSCKYIKWIVIWSLLCITVISAAFLGNRGSNTVTAPLWEWESMERQRFLVLHPEYVTGSLLAAVMIHEWIEASTCDDCTWLICKTPTCGISSWLSVKWLLVQLHLSRMTINLS